MEINAEADGERRDGGAGEVSPWFEGGAGGRRGNTEPDDGPLSWDDDYRDVIPGVDYLTAVREARSAESEVLSVLGDLVASEGAWIRSEKLVTHLGGPVLRVAMPVCAWRESVALMRDGLRYRARKVKTAP